MSLLLPPRELEVSLVCGAGWGIGAANPLFPIAVERRRWWRGRARSTQRVASHPLVGETVSPSERRTVLKSDRRRCIPGRKVLRRSAAHGESGGLAFRKGCPSVSARLLKDSAGY